MPLPCQSLPLHGPGKRWTVGTLSYSTSGLVLVIFWLLLAQVGVSLRDRAAADATSLLLRRLGASNTALAFLTVVVSTAIVVLFGPAISYRSDRFRSRWGRRIPFLLVAIPIATAGMIGIAFTPELGDKLRALCGAGPLADMNHALIVFGVCSAIYQIASVTTGMAYTGLVNDVVPRPVMGRTFSLIRMISLICGIVINYGVYRYFESHFRLLFLLLAAIFFVTFMAMCLAVREGDYPPPPDVIRTGPTWRQELGGAFSELWRARFWRAKLAALVRVLWLCFPPRVRQYIVLCFSRSYYRWVIAALTLGALCAVPVNAFSPWYMKSLGMDLETYGKIKAVNHFCGFLLAFPIGMLVDRFHVLRVSMVTMGMYAVTLMLGAMFIQSPWSFGWAVFGHMVVAGFYLSASGALAPLLLPRLKFAQFLAASTVVTSIATMITSLAMGYILDKTNNNYRLTYVASSILAFSALAVMIVVYRKFMALGGPKGYTAPE
ncbi:MAG TPA: MFS transporter [Tepidisphaeraceae bacterium]|nr:MFS transporter [Tepidisphaeraceae bacterium]